MQISLISRITYYASNQVQISFNRTRSSIKGSRITEISESKDDSSIKSKGMETFKPPRYSCSSIASMSIIDLKGLNNTSRVPKPIYIRNNSKKEVEYGEDFEA